MKSYITGVLLFTTLGINSLFAAESPTDLRVLETEGESISLDWEDTEGAIGYYIYYGTKTGTDTGYESEGIDLIDQSNFLLEDLIPNTPYYIAVTSIDSFGEESGYSTELEHSTVKSGDQSVISDFKIQDIEVLDTTTLQFIFSSELQTDDSAIREFIVEEKDSGDEILIDITHVDENNTKNVLVLLGSPLKTSTDYKVIVLDVTDINGNTIESGIDAFLEFTSPGTITSKEEEQEVAEKQAMEEQKIVEEEAKKVAEEERLAVEKKAEEDEVQKGLQSAGPESIGNAGTSLSREELEGSVTQTAENNNKLPQTGPEHWLLFFVAILLAGGIYFKKSTVLEK